jgi:hypothetical protein
MPDETPPPTENGATDRGLAAPGLSLQPPTASSKPSGGGEGGAAGVDAQGRATQPVGTQPSGETANDALAPLKEATPERITFLFSNEKMIHENLKFADTKAGVLIVLDCALVKGVWTSLLPSLFACPTCVSAWIACIVLGAAIAVAVRGVIWPRTPAKKERGLVDPNRIAYYGVVDDKTAEGAAMEFTKDMGTVPHGDLFRDLAGLVFRRSRTDVKKYFWLKWVIVLSAFGVLAAAAGFAVERGWGHNHESQGGQTQAHDAAARPDPQTTPKGQSAGMQPPPPAAGARDASAGH